MSLLFDDGRIKNRFKWVNMQIGITGIANGGKTVFLTSLLWHLWKLGASDFILDGDELIDAQKHPKNYGHLVVRIAGLNALFVELSKLE
ncbi:MAG: hypothetical protein PF692_11195 [Kiritimatiellae bacterium]|nr:hypothetical protein [Kiritimatiellia bacterium]